MSEVYEELLALCIRQSRLGLMDQAAETAALLIDPLQGSVPEVARLDALTRLIWIEFHRGRHQVAMEIAQAAIAMAVQMKDKARESIARSFRARLFCELDEIKAAADEGVTAIELARATGLALPQSIAFSVLSIISAPLGLYDAAVALAREAIAYAELSGDSEALAHALINDGSIHGDNLFRLGPGTPEEKRDFLGHGIAQSQAAFRLARLHDDGEMYRLAAFNLVEFNLMAGDLPQAEAAMRETEAEIANASNRGAMHRSYALTLLQMARGDVPGAIAVLRESIDKYIAYPFMELAVFASEHLATALAQIGDYEGAYFALKKFHSLERRFSDQRHGSYLQSALIRDQIANLRAAISAERERSETLAKVHAALQAEAKHLLRASFEDPLTGIGNRRKLNAVIADLTAQNHAYAIAILDLDYFKMINDQHSHLVGDEVLRRVAAMIRAIVSQSSEKPGVAIRLGGEEFAAILMAPGQSDALAICEMLRASIEAYSWRPIAESLRVTTSIGLALSSEGTEEATCMSIADNRLYHAKHTGRNRVVAWGMPPTLH